MRLLFEQEARRLAALLPAARQLQFQSMLTASIAGQCDGWGKNLGYSAWVRNHKLFPHGASQALLRSFWPGFSNHLDQLPYSGLLSVRQSIERGEPFSSTREMALFSALVEAEGMFLQDYLPFSSHEERLTGALVSTLAQVGMQYLTLSSGALGGSGPKITLFDLATDRREKVTGADIGLISWSEIGGKPVVKIARLQVKVGHQSAKREVMGASYKVANASGAHEGYVGTYPVGHKNFEQLNALCRTPSLGYYLVLVPAGDPNTHPTSVCLVSPAEQVLKKIQDHHKPDDNDPGQTMHVGDDIASVPLPIFLGLGMTRANTQWGLQVRRNGGREEILQAAVEELVGQGPPPKFCLCVDSTTDGPDLRKVLSKLRDLGRSDEPTAAVNADEAQASFNMGGP